MSPCFGLHFGDLGWSGRRVEILCHWFGCDFYITSRLQQHTNFCNVCFTTSWCLLIWCCYCQCIISIWGLCLTVIWWQQQWWWHGLSGCIAGQPQVTCMNLSMLSYHWWWTLLYWQQIPKWQLRVAYLFHCTNGRAYATVLRLSVVCLWRYVLWLNGAS